MGLFPTLGHFLFWLLWPVVISRLTRLVCLQLTGRTLPRRKIIELRKYLAEFARGIMKEDPPKERPMKKTTKTTISHATAGAAGGVVGAIALIAALDYAFRIPQDVARMKARIASFRSPKTSD